MIEIAVDKTKIDELLRKRDTKKDIYTAHSEKEDEYEQMIQPVSKIDEPLTIIICSEEKENYYTEIRSTLENVLTCSDIRYLNSVNHLDNVRSLILDYSSFTDANEVAFLIKVFELLHRKADIVIAYEEYTEISKLQKLIRDEKAGNRAYVILYKNLKSDYERHMIMLSEAKMLKQKRKLYFSGRMKKLLIILMIGILTLLFLTGGIYFYMQHNVRQTIHNRNLNVQLDMGTSTILPIDKIYADDQGCHIIVEEVNDGEEMVQIGLYDQDQRKIAADVQKTACPEEKCNSHYELIFSRNEEVKYYILQLINSQTTRNIEIDQLYFE